MGRKDFSDRQKADIYVLDRATCAYSGRNLWLLDHGADSRYISDWADHLTPVSRGGDASLENGVCASWVCNYAKLDTGSRPLLLFFRGLPTPDFFYLYDTIPDQIAENLTRFRQLHYSDWYLNRAIWRTCLGVCWLHDGKNLAGKMRSRDAHYYARASLKFLTQWRAIVSKEGIESLEQRGLVPPVSSTDRSVMLALRDVTDEEEVLEMMRLLLPFHTANSTALSAQHALTVWSESTSRQAEKLLAAIRQDKRVSPAILANVEANFFRLRQAVRGTQRRKNRCV